MYFFNGCCTVCRNTRKGEIDSVRTDPIDAEVIPPAMPTPSATQKLSVVQAQPAAPAPPAAQPCASQAQPAAAAPSAAQPCTPKARVSIAENEGAADAPSPTSDATSRDPVRSVLPFKRTKSRLPTTAEIDAGTGGDPGQSAEARKAIMRSATGTEWASEKSDRRTRPSFKKKDSQLSFASQNQTVIVFDWDDTLFPTSYIQDALGLDWQLPLADQRILREQGTFEEVEERMTECQERAMNVLRKASELGHVVILTLASSGWVELSCNNFYPEVGKLVDMMCIPIIYAQEKMDKEQVAYDKSRFKTNEDVERFWGLAKGRAISDELDQFYSQYEGQSWKNVLSIGDSSFERYGLLAATSAYMQDAELGRDGAVWSPSQEGCWQKTSGGRVLKLRAKCCKLLDDPDVEELTLQLGMVLGWLPDMVQLDNGFDLDMEALEETDHVNVIEAVLRGEKPVSALPRPRPHTDD